MKDYSILLGGNLEEMPIASTSNDNTTNNNSTSTNTNLNIDTNNNNPNVNNNNELNPDDVQSFQTILDELMGANDGNNSNNPNSNNNVNNNNNDNTIPTADNTNNNEIVAENPEDQPTLSPQQFQDMLKSYVDLLDDRTIPDEDPRITGAICQWYSYSRTKPIFVLYLFLFVQVYDIGYRNETGDADLDREK
jgi:hypothetical protein